MNAVTGALSYTGRAIAEELLRRDVSLSRRDDPGDPLRSRIELRPPRFDDSLTASLEGVHISVTGADAADDLPYFRGKHRLEQWLERSELDRAVVRPTLVFGPNDILVNNIAWILRRLPLFVVPRPADCLVQPVSVRDVARLAADAESGTRQDAAGQEVLEFRRVVELIATAVGSRARIVEGSRALALAAVRVGNAVLRDVVVTRDELSGLARSLLTSSSPPQGHDSFSTWLGENRASLGRRYESELRRNFRGQE